MKKKITALLAGLMAVVTVSGCSGVATSSFTGSYWLDDYTVKTAPDGFYERLEYEISSVKNDDSENIPTYAPSLYQSGKLEFTINTAKSLYVTELYTENGNYIYETKMTVYGTYAYNYDESTESFKNTYEVENDTVTTKTVFKDFNGKFAPISSERAASTVFPMYATPTEEAHFKKIAYKSVTEYGEKDAKLTVTPDDPISKEYLSAVKDPVTVKKYNKKAYIENDIMVLLFRTFKLDSSLSYSFSSIENVTGSLKQVSGTARTQTASATSESSASTGILPMSIDACSLDGGASRYEVKFDVMGVTFATTGEFAQTFVTAYYEIARKDSTASSQSKHLMVKSYQPSIYNCGYTVYTLHTVYSQRPTV